MFVVQEQPNVPDSFLVDDARKGNEAALGILFRRYREALYRFALRRCREEEDARDVVQETFLKAMKAIGRLRSNGSFRSWLYRIAANVSTDLLKGRTKRRQLREDYRIQTEGSESTVGLKKELFRAFKVLSERERQAILLTIFQGLSQREAAVQLNCAETTVSWHVFQAKGKLREHMQ